MKTGLYSSTRYLPFGDTAIVIEFADTICLEANRRVISLNDSMLRAGVNGVEELVPSYRSLLIRYDPLKTGYEQLVFHVKDLEKSGGSTDRAEGRKIVVPVVYGGEYGPDLGHVAQVHGLTQKQVISFHSGREYRVYMIGFAAGFPYLGEVPDEIATPRLETPRLKVPACSVGIAEKQTGIYPCEAPGGWQIVGRTPARLFDLHMRPPTLLSPGDKVTFRPISEDEHKALLRE